MSGGVGPSSDIGLPKEEEQHQRGEATENLSPFPKRRRARRGIFSLTNLNALAIIVVLAASGMVSLQDFLFVLTSMLYIHFISKVAFPTLSPDSDAPIFGDNNKLLGIYVMIGALIGLFLPIAYIFEGILEGDKEGIKAAAPHVFLLASQVFMEGVASRFSLPIRVFVPVAYNSVRMFAIIDWLRSEISKVDEEYGGSVRRLYVGRALAVANVAFWSFNLFGFLLPYYLPKAFKRYYSGNDKVKKGY